MSLKRAEDVKGYDKLSDTSKAIFKEFLGNFYKRWEYPEKHMPEKVKLVKDKADGEYLRVDFATMWLHVKNSTIWY